MIFHRNILSISSHRTYYPKSRRVSSCTSFTDGAKGSITVEASLVVPLFFLAIVSLFYMMEVMAVRTAVRSGMQYAAKKASEQSYLLPAVTPQSLQRDIVKSVGDSRLNRSIVAGGSEGIRCEASSMSAVTGILDLRISYDILLPIPLFEVPPVKMEERMRVKGWTGYIRTGFGGADDTTVYITETGMVYHVDYHCTYLELSIKMVPVSALPKLRNEGQGKYYACGQCVKGKPSGNVYITDTGDHYHSSLGCSGLKRTVYAVPLAEAAGKGVCRRCGK